MAEPQTNDVVDGRLDLPWVAQNGAILTEAPVPGGSPFVVGSADGPHATAEYIVGLHNRAHHERTQLPVDATAAADAYMHDAWNGASSRDTVPLERVRDGFVDGFKEGWIASTATGQKMHKEDRDTIRELRERVTRLESARTEALDRAEQFQAAYNTADRERRDHWDALNASRAETAKALAVVARKTEEAERLDAELADLRDVAAANGQTAPLFPNRPSMAATVAAPGSELLPDDYDKGTVLHGAGHHSPSYAEGYRDGRNDTAQAIRTPMEERDQALYAAHLLLTESVAAHEPLRLIWQKAVRRWQDEYVAIFGDGEADR